MRWPRRSATRTSASSHFRLNERVYGAMNQTQPNMSSFRRIYSSWRLGWRAPTMHDCFEFGSNESHGDIFHSSSFRRAMILGLALAHTTLGPQAGL